MRKCASFLHLRTFHFFSTPIHRSLINSIKHRMREGRGGMKGGGGGGGGGEGGCLKQNNSHYNVSSLLYLCHIPACILPSLSSIYFVIEPSFIYCICFPHESM